MKMVYLIFLFICISSFSQTETTIRLNGAWRFKIDSLDVGKLEKWSSQNFEETVRLPGSMTENGKGNAPSSKTHWLTPEKQYVGVAWYQRDVTLPKTWTGKQIVLNLERVHWKSTVWIDSSEMGTHSSFSTPHRYYLTNIKTEGRHRITIRVDNRNTDRLIDQNSNCLSNNSLGNWNGIIGTIQLDAIAPIWITDLQLFPDFQKKEITAKIKLDKVHEKQIGNIKITIQSKPPKPKPSQTIATLTVPFSIETDTALTVEIPIIPKIQTWDEFNPVLYTCKVEIICKSGSKYSTETNFGFRKIQYNNNHFEINTIPVFLRGTVESSIFPQTGYPPTEESIWIRIFRKCKSYGLNHVRFQSYCPPEAAFDAADKIGIYLQVDLPIVADSISHYSEDLKRKFITDETLRIIKEYGNHPSFCFLNISKNLKSQSFDSITSLLSNDTRRFYSISNQNRNNHFSLQTAHSTPLSNCISDRLYNFDSIITKPTNPTIITNLGQWTSFPNYREISKYSGIYSPSALENSHDLLQLNNLENFSNDFHKASGKLQVLCYKMEIEAALRTKNIVGFQLQSLVDFTRNGMATIGVLDAFWDNKTYVDTLNFKEFCNTTVPLIQMPKYSYTNNELLKIAVEIAHFGNKPIENITPKWRIRGNNNIVLDSGVLQQTSIPIGNGFSLGTIVRPLVYVTNASMLQLEVSVGKYYNKWNFWVYPFLLPKTDTTQIYFCNTLNSKAEDILKIGGKVLLMANENDDMKNRSKIYFTPFQWNTNSLSHTTGVLIDSSHPVFKTFPTQSFSNLQWQNILQNRQIMYIDSFPKNFRSIVQPIDTWQTNRRLTMLFEAKVENGRIFVCSYRLNTLTDLDGKQLVWSIKKYMISELFEPKQTLQIESIRNLFE